MRMKQIGKLWMALAMLLVCLLTPLSADNVMAYTTPKLNKTSLSLNVGSEATLNVENADGYGGITWKSNKTKVATVTQDGIVKAHSPGKAKITATTYYYGVKLTCTVKVADPAGSAYDIKVTGTDGGDFVLGGSKLEVSFKMNSDATNVKAQVLDDSDKVVYTKTFPTCKKGKEQTFSWKGGKLEGGSICRVKFTAGKTVTYSDYVDVLTKASTGFAGGNGSPSKPYQVKNLEQLKNVALYSTRCFKQTQDIDGDYATFEAICGADIGFTGNYDGGNHTISNLIIKDGIFATVGEGGVVENLKFSECTATEGSGVCKRDNYTGVGILAAWNCGKIQNCSFTSCSVSTGDNDRAWSCAGIVCGRQYEKGEIRSCTVDQGKVEGVAAKTLAGGITGVTEGKIINAKVSDSNMNIVSTGYWNDRDYYGGGIAGKNTTSGVITNCTVAAGSITVPNAERGYAGGITGLNEGNIIKCRATAATEGHDKGTITGNKEGGIVTN